MVDEERGELAVGFENAAETYLESLVEALAEYAQNGHYGAYRGYDELQGLVDIVPSENHEGDCGHKEGEGDKRRKVEGEAALHVLGHCLAGRAVCVAHALAQRVVVVVALEEHGAERGRKRERVKR